MAAGIRVGGKIWPVVHPITGHPIPVLGPEDHKVEFKAGDGYNKKRVADIDLGVIHWTGSENAVEVMVETLRQRSLGVEFSISPFAVIYQFCDPLEVDTADAGIVNSRSWGVEVVNAGIRRMNTLWREPQYRKPPLGPRLGYDTKIHGKSVKCYDFYPAQTQSLIALNITMTQAISTYPRDVCVVPGVLPESVLRGPDKTKLIKGAIGHYNITTDKLDPGTKPMNDLAFAMGANNV